MEHTCRLVYCPKRQPDEQIRAQCVGIRNVTWPTMAELNGLYDRMTAAIEEVIGNGEYGSAWRRPPGTASAS